MNFVVIDSGGKTRRRDRRTLLMLLAVFVTVFSFVFLTQKFKGSEDTEATSLANFDPGYIISDYQMGNYTSMSEAEIQNFLTSKNPCNNTNYSYYLQLSANKNYTWHWENGHFVCLSEERFGDGEVIGSGETAAHIIWQAAQDYRINPRVLIVLLQKETGLITDPIPNNGDYRKATGYGCPDTAACSSKYYGFKNQIRNAAALFRTVLDGGWTNYPLGDNYIQYNPNADCGGSIVNVRSLATSALYRYTPYQPNAGAIAAGYGTASCGAYGNRNFYLYFEDWFGGVTEENLYSAVELPRYMKTTKDTYYINPQSGAKTLIVKMGVIMKYTTKTKTKDDKWCIRTAEDTKNNINRCIEREDLEDLSYENVDKVRYMKILKDTYYINPNTKEKGVIVKKDEIVLFDNKILGSDGRWCIRTAEDTKNNINRCIEREDLDNVPDYMPSSSPRYMKVTEDTNFINPYTLEKDEKIKSGEILNFTSKIIDKNGDWCIRTEEDSVKGIVKCIMRNFLGEAPNFMSSNNARKMIVVADDAVFINPYTLEQQEKVDKGQVFWFNTKIIDKNGDWCIRTEEDSVKGIVKCISRSSLGEI